MGASLNSRGGGSRRYRKTQFTEINVTPMVDVMLVLLIIFMVAAPMLTAGVDVDLPESRAVPLKGQDEPIAVSIKSDGTIYVQKSKIKIDDLGKKLKAVSGEKPETRIFVRGDRSVDYGRVMVVVGEINSAGFNKVSLVTETGNSAPTDRR